MMISNIKGVDFTDNKNGFTMTCRDHIMVAWLESTNLVSNFRDSAHDTVESDRYLSQLFDSYAKEEALHAAKFLEMLKSYEKKDSMQ